MSGTRWTDEEIDYLRSHYGRGRWKAIGRRLGRSEAAVAQKASLLGLKQLQWKKGSPPQDLLDFIRTQHAAGALDADMARQWNDRHPERSIGRRSLCYLRRSLGLTKNEASILQRRREGYERQMQVLGVSSVTDLSTRHRKREAMKAGWKVPTTPMERQILALMLDGELRGRLEIAEAVGHAGRPQRHWFKCKYGAQSALANLVRKRLLKRTGKRIRRGEGKGHSVYLYWMPLDVMRNRTRRSA